MGTTKNNSNSTETPNAGKSVNATSLLVMENELMQKKDQQKVQLLKNRLDLKLQLHVNEQELSKLGGGKEKEDCGCGGAGSHKEPIITQSLLNAALERQQIADSRNNYCGNSVYVFDPIDYMLFGALATTFFLIILIKYNKREKY